MIRSSSVSSQETEELRIMADDGQCVLGVVLVVSLTEVRVGTNSGQPVHRIENAFQRELNVNRVHDRGHLNNLRDCDQA